LAAGVLAFVLAILLLLNRQLRIQAQKTTKQLKRLQDTLPGALYEYKIGADGVGEFLYFSESIHAVTGFDAHVLLGSHNLLTNRIHHEDLPRFSSAITISRDTGKPFFVEVRLQVADGSWKWLQMNAAAQSEDFTTTWSGHILDITERKRLEMMADRALLIQQENEAIARLLKEKVHLVTTMLHDNRSVVTDALSASIAHELNQPLGASSLNIQFLKRQLERGELPSSLNREILNNLDDDNQRIANFIQTLRSIFLDSNPTSSVLDLNAQIQEVLGILRPAISAANISLDLQFSAGLHVVISKNDLQKVLLNLINNAIESLRAGSSSSDSNESNTITLSSSRVGDSVFFSVTDNGRGIPTEQIPSLFELLAGNQEKATGVGLWLCQHIIHRYAGKIWHEQPNTTGCRFVIELPSYLGSSNLQRLP
jgi:PAS domain S-box-containing protein